MAEGDEFKIFEYGVSRTYSKGELLFSYGDESDALFIVQKGEIEVFLLTEEGKKLSLNVLKPGEIFGEIGVLDGGKRTAFAEAKNRSTVKRIPRNLIVEKIRDGSDPEFAYYLINVLCSRIRWINEQVEHLAISGVEERLANKLVILHLKFSDENGVLNLSQSELSEFLGTSRETVNKIVNNWRSQGFVQLSRGAVQIKDLAALKLHFGIV